jgi:hypothetical protein
MSKRYFLFSFLTYILATHSTQAQKRAEDVLYLKNGSILRGKIVELDADTVKIEIIGGSMFVYPVTEARGITKEKPNLTYKSSGYMFSLEAGALTGKAPKNQTFSANENVTGFTLQCVNGYQFRRELATGIGFGIDSYYNYVITPLYLRINGVLFDRQISPMYIVDAGYGFYSNLFNENFTGNSKGGIMVNPAVGVRIRLAKNSSFIVNAGYRYQTLSTSTSLGAPGDGIREKSTYKRLSIRAGFMF